MSTTSYVASRRRLQRGYGLLEMVISIAIMSLVFLGATFLLDTSARTAARTQAQIYASGDAANSIQKVIAQLREANGFTVPVSKDPGIPEIGWIVPSGTTAGQFVATLALPGGGTETFATAVEITQPGSLTPGSNGYKAGVTDISVQSSTGTAIVMNPTKSPYVQKPYDNAAAGATTVLIYRGDPDGTPDADPTGSAVTGAGTYLWQYTLPPDGTFNLAATPPNQSPLCKSVASASNAVQFVRAVYANAASADQVQVKIISGYYSPINGQQTNEEGNGASSSQLIGKCVYMRDHKTGANQLPADARTGNTPFQYH